MKNKVRLAVPYIQTDSIVDGSGIRSVIWFQGCAHNCEGCHNPITHSFKDGYLMDVKDVKKLIDNLTNQKGITFSGGDPVYQINALIELIKYAKSKNLDIWVYTGFTYEEILKINRGLELLHLIDTLVDGKFDITKRSLDIPFRGSTNQRIINVQESLKNNIIVEYPEYKTKLDRKNLYKKDNDIFI